MANSGRCILLVEDDPNDVFFLQHAFEQAGIANPLKVVTGGCEAIRYLAGEGEFSDRKSFPFPFLMLLDLNLPGMPGLDVLKWVRERKRELPLLLSVVLTSSQHEHDVEESYRLGACSFLVKPLSTADRIKLARAIKEYWIEWNVPPSQKPL